MATKKISELTAASTLNGTELVPVVQSSATKKTTVADFATLIGDGADGIDGVDGAPGPAGASADSIFTIPANARKWAAALAARTVASPARFIWYGDSVTEGIYGSTLLRFRKRMARFNGGRVSPGWVHGSPPSQDVTGGVNNLHTYTFRLTTGTLGANEAAGNFPGERGLGLYSFKLNSGSVLTLQIDPTLNVPTPTTSWSDAVTAAPIFSTAEFHYTAHGTDADIGTATITIDIGTANEEVVTGSAINGYDATLGAGAYDTRTVTWTGDEGPHTITVTGGGSDPFWFDGVYLALSDETVWTYDGGNAGERFADFLNEPAGHADPPALQAGAAVDADCVIFAYGLNDHDFPSAGAGAAAYGTNITAAITSARAVIDPDVSIGVLIPYAKALITNWPDYVDAAEASITAAGVGKIDTSWMLAVNGGTTDPHDLLTDLDDVHHNTGGGEFWADRVATFLTGDLTDWASIITTARTHLYSIRSNAATQNITTGATINLQALVDDLIGDVDYSFALFTPRVAGWWSVSASAEFQANATGTRILNLKVGSTDHPFKRVPACPSGVTTVDTTRELYLATNDAVGIRASQDSGSTLTCILRQASFRWMHP